MTVLEAQPQTRAPAVPSSERPRFRKDIAGLRAVAVLLVVAYHAHVPGLGGGYVGVDVFFVISGFLITGQLTREVQRSGRLRLTDFYARRIRRLLPPAAIVTSLTVLGSWLWAAPLQTRATARDALYTVFYGLNYRLAAEGIDYQRASAPPSPLQHYWSLAVEEQFYLLWPLLLLAVVALARKRWMKALPCVLVVVVVLSLGESVRLIASNAPLAYFSVQSRAWELAVGALVALVAPRITRGRSVLAGGGLVLVIGAALVFTDSTRFPGWTAMVPVGGAALLIAAGASGSSFVEERLLGSRPVQGLGAVSYSWYLWHWPILILAPLALNHSLSWVDDSGLMVGALALAVLTYLVVEKPAARIRLSKADWASGGLLLSLLTTTVAVLLSADAVASLAAPVEPFVTSATGLADPFASTRTSGAVTPGVLDAVKNGPAYPADCIVEVQGTVSPSCLIAPDGRLSNSKPGRNRIVLIGDSHAGEFFDPLQSLAAKNGWYVEVLNKVGCPIADLETVNSALQRTYTECDTWRANTLARLAKEPTPQIVFTAELNRYPGSQSRQEQGWQSTMTRLRATGAPVVYLQDTPFPGKDIPNCISGTVSRGSSWGSCSFTQSQAYLPDVLAEHPTGLAATIDVNPWLCPGTGDCPAVRGGVLLYRDDSHVTRTAMSALTTIIGQQLVNAHVLPGTPKRIPVPS